MELPNLIPMKIYFHFYLSNPFNSSETLLEFKVLTKTTYKVCLYAIDITHLNCDSKIKEKKIPYFMKCFY